MPANGVIDPAPPPPQDATVNAAMKAAAVPAMIERSAAIDNSC
jgi:hypothetical protein